MGDHLHIDCATGQAVYRPATEAELAAIITAQRDAAALQKQEDDARAQLQQRLAEGGPEAVRALAQLLGVVPIARDTPGGL